MRALPPGRASTLALVTKVQQEFCRRRGHFRCPPSSEQLPFLAGTSCPSLQTPNSLSTNHVSNVADVSGEHLEASVSSRQQDAHLGLTSVKPGAQMTLYVYNFLGAISVRQLVLFPSLFHAAPCPFIDHHILPWCIALNAESDFLNSDALASKRLSQLGLLTVDAHP